MALWRSNSFDYTFEDCKAVEALEALTQRKKKNTTLDVVENLRNCGTGTSSSPCPSDALLSFAGKYWKRKLVISGNAPPGLAWLAFPQADSILKTALDYTTLLRYSWYLGNAIHCGENLAVINLNKVCSDVDSIPRQPSAVQ